jgi:hypothetical protein
VLKHVFPQYGFATIEKKRFGYPNLIYLLMVFLVVVVVFLGHIAAALISTINI